MKTSICLFSIIILILSCKDEKITKHFEDQAIEARQNQITTQHQLDSIRIMMDEFRIESTNSTIPGLRTLYEDCRKSVLILVTFDENEQGLAQGSAFVIGENGLGISNYHVFENANAVVAIDYEGNRYLITEFYNYDEALDYIYFRVPNYSLPVLNIAPILPNIGDQCFAIGAPYGLDQTLSTGIISAYRSNSNIIQTSAEITHGSSGGPLFNAIGQVIGITSSGRGEANLNFAVNLLILPIAVTYYTDNLSSLPIANALRIDNESPERPINDNEQLTYDYYNNLFNKEWDLLRNQYADIIKEFPEYSDVTKSFVISAQKSYYNRFIVENYKISSNSYQENIIENNIESEVIYELNIIRNSDGERFYHIIKSKLIFNDEGKIISVKEEEL